MNKYLFQITDEILNKATEISQLIGQVSESSSLSGFVNDGKLLKIRIGKTWAYSKNQ